MLAAQHNWHSAALAFRTMRKEYADEDALFPSLPDDDDDEPEPVISWSTRFSKSTEIASCTPVASAAPARAEKLTRSLVYRR